MLRKLIAWFKYKAAVKCRHGVVVPVGQPDATHDCSECKDRLEFVMKKFYNIEPSKSPIRIYSKDEL